MRDQAGYYRQPTIHGETIVFVCEDDLWSVPAEGGVARRLTANPGTVSFPRFSPDGKRLAFAGRDEGPTEVYVMDAGGGEPRRLTFTGGNFLRPVGWARDGKSVVFNSNAGQPFLGKLHLHEVPVAGGRTRLLTFGPSREIAFEPNGKGVVLGINSGDPARWKRYRGGTAGTLWVDRSGKGAFAPLLELEGNVAGPMWIGKRIWFLSDHEGHGNLYSCTPTGRGLRRHTDHEDYYVRFPSTDGKRIVYHAGADLYVFDVKEGRARKVEVALRSPRAERNRRFVGAADYLESAALHPKGHSAVCVARGGAYTFGLWEGVPRRHGEISHARYRLARWLPDGKRLVAVHDEEGEDGLVLFGTARPKRWKLDLGRVLDLEVAPKGADRVALTNHRQELWVVDLKTGKGKVVERSGFDRIRGSAWSPDGRWLAYGIAVSLRASAIHVCDTRSGKIHEITRPDFQDLAPAFDPEGNYLYFLSHRVYDPVYDNQYFDLGFPRAMRPYLVPLRADLPSPFDPATREPRAPRGDDDSHDGKKRKKTPVAVRIDFAGITDRIVAFPVEEGKYHNILGAPGRALFLQLPVEGSLSQDWTPAGPPPAINRLVVHDFKQDKTETLLPEITGFRLSLDGRTLLVRAGNELRALPATIEPKEVSTKDEYGREAGWIDLERLRVAVVPGDEWRQMFREAWRLQRDQFWTPDMSQIDWRAVHDRYLPLVDRVGTRAEFSDLMWEMQGELGTSHCYEMGGDYLPAPGYWHGFLGADLEWRAGAWRVKRIPRGDSWNEQARSPLAAPGTGIREGDRILAIDGRPVGATHSPHERLVHRARRPVTLTVRRGDGRPRDVTVTTLGAEFALRYRDWVEANRARVHKESRGRVGYVHVPNMGPVGYAEFHRYFKTEMDRDGLIIDVRWNGGGHVSQLLLEKLLRKRVGYDASRWQGLFPYPSEAPVGPMVALTNEYAGSDGDIFSHCFKLYGLGPLIGKRTWGGVVGIWPRHALVDGTVTTQPEFSFWFEDVGYGVENYGTDPDLEVDITPQDHARGKDPQLETGIREVTRILKTTKILKPDLARRPSLKAPRLPKEK